MASLYFSIDGINLLIVKSALKKPALYEVEMRALNLIKKIFVNGDDQIPSPSQKRSPISKLTQLTLPAPACRWCNYQPLCDCLSEICDRRALPHFASFPPGCHLGFPLQEWEAQSGLVFPWCLLYPRVSQGTSQGDELEVVDWGVVVNSCSLAPPLTPLSP